MIPPASTYRLQFRNGMTFDRAAQLAPYLRKLGISHLYTSPIFTATSGSTHGYDVTDDNEIDPVLGGREGFNRMVRALRAEGLGLILDIVPNHMAASLENPWWRDVVEHGEESPYANHFDIDWSSRLTLPFLGDTFGNELENGEIAVKPDPVTGKPALVCYDTFYPLKPATWEGREADVLAIADKDDIVRLHDEQPYRLMSWHEARRELSYRRFFEVTGLVGVRVEDARVFDDTHRLVLELVRNGAVDGLRVDHVDGLADPKGYLETLRQHAGQDCYIVVEKILGKGERIATDWPVSGTTGYEFIDTISDVLVDDEKLDRLRASYEAVSGHAIDMGAELRSAKLLMAERNFAGEVNTLLGLALRIEEAERKDIVVSESVLYNALRELLVTFPVYRIYGTRDRLSSQDRHVLASVIDTVRKSANAPDPQALAFIERVLTGDVGLAMKDLATIFRTRFQQLTGPLMAKSVEDTLFFRQNAALALNEVGADPLPRRYSPAQFHQEMQARLETQPFAMSGSSTHDTKRGEDARSRLYALTEAPEFWAAAIERWREMNSGTVQVLAGGAAPESAVEWLLYQTLAGCWPMDLHPDNKAGLEALKERFVAYAEKALREAKLRTDWIGPDQAYEEAVIAYARHLLSPDNSIFLHDFTDTLLPFAHAGLINSVTATIIKLTAPGVPDIYQGSEAADFSLMDPDNRREPDFEALQKQLDDTAPLTFTDKHEWYSGKLKQHVIARLLQLRQTNPKLFLEGDYTPLSATGERADNLVAFARSHENQALVAIAPRLVFRAQHIDEAPFYSGGWENTDIVLPDGLAGGHYRDLFTGKLFTGTDRLAVGDVVGERYFSVLQRQ